MLKNIGVLTLSSFATKMLTFFLVPLYTNVLTTTEYGIYDLFNTTISVLIPIITLNIQEAVLRFAMDKKYSREAIVTIALRYFIISCTIILLGLCVNCVFGFSQNIKEYAVYFFLMFFVHTLSGIVPAYIRGVDKIVDLSISSVVSSIVTICCNVIFLVCFNLGLKGYFLANIIGPLVQCIYLLIRVNIFRNINLRNQYPAEKKAMLDYCKPMIANSIAWWINSASDRYIIIFFCGLSENGIYSVASKIPSILNLFQTVFNQAWTLSVVKEFDSEDKDGFFANTYKTYNCLMVLMCSAIIVADKILAKFLYAKDFYIAWRYVPWLTIAITFGALSGYIGGFFSAVKDSNMYAKSTMLGATTNVILNIILVPFFDALGAAISTAVCYIVVWAIRYYHSKKYIKLRINIYRDIVSYIFLVAQAVFLIVSDVSMLYIVETIIFVMIVGLYIKDIRLLFSKFCK